MKERVKTPFTRTLGRRELEEIITRDLIAQAKPGSEPLASVEITEVSIPPTGVQVVIRGERSEMQEVPDKVFAPPTRS